MELLNNADIENKLIPAEIKDKFKGKSIRAAHLDGIIYINIEKARIEDSLHEYTHLLLGIV
jgi:hypothetical protein